MRLRVVTPLEVVVEEEADAVVAEDASGLFGVRPGHAELVTVLSPSVLTWRAGEREGHVAVRGGVLHVRGRGAEQTVEVATREAMTSDDLAALGEVVARAYRAEDAEEARQRLQDARLQTAVYRSVLRYLRPALPGLGALTPPWRPGESSGQ
ncbi:MAG: F0F1 ATP synthase subunit epsilon [Planctomycetota bacterium]